MPVKSKIHRTHHISHKKEKRTKHFLRVYAPYIPLLLIVATGISISSHSEVQRFGGAVQSYATNTSADGLLQETNKRRSAEGLPGLIFNSSLQSAAQTKAEDMKTRNYWAHVTPDGREPWDFIEKANYHYIKAAENLAYGFDSSNSTLNGWMNSAGHRANVMDPALQEVGFGITNVPEYQGHGEETIVVAEYGQPVVAGANSVPLPVNSTPASTVATAQPHNISLIQSLTAGKAPWSGLAIGIIIGSIIMYLSITHARGVRRTLRRSERFIVHHPLLDITLVALVALLAIASQTIGTTY